MTECKSDVNTKDVYDETSLFLVSKKSYFFIYNELKESIINYKNKKYEFIDDYH